jgi:hypothetical protein
MMWLVYGWFDGGDGRSRFGFLVMDRLLGFLCSFLMRGVCWLIIGYFLRCATRCIGSE